MVVLLVDDASPPAGSGLSCGCQWDYAVTIRNSRPLVLILSAPDSWDGRPESLTNTTETLGGVGLVTREHDDVLQSYLVREVASRLNIPEKQVRELARIVRTELAKLELASREVMWWDVFDSLLAAAATANPADAACYAAGLPVIDASGKSFRELYAILGGLAAFVSSTGLSDAIDQMKGTNAAQRRGVVSDLDALHQHLAPHLLSPTAFETAPSRHFRVTGQVPAWYTALNAEVLDEILTELNQRQPQGRLNLRCVNGLPNGQPLRGGPFIVSSAPEVHASSASGQPPPVVDFSRKVDRTPPVQLPPLPTSNLQCRDVNPPVHRKPIKYKQEGVCPAPIHAQDGGPSGRIPEYGRMTGSRGRWRGCAAPDPASAARNVHPTVYRGFRCRESPDARLPEIQT